MTPISVVVVDDHDLLREGVSACLASFDDIEVVGEASNGQQAITLVGTIRPDVVVMDLVMPGLSGTETISLLREQHAEMGIVALSSFSEPARVREVVDAGANGYLIKSVDAPSLARAVRGASVGQSSFSAEVTNSLMSAREDPGLSALTVREEEVARLVANGRTNAEIADQLDLSIFTVKNHVSSVLMKLHVRTRTEAASIILRAED